jgi:hypothetical protein
MAPRDDHGIEVAHRGLARREVGRDLEALPAVVVAARDRAHEDDLEPGRPQQVGGAGQVGILELIFHQQGHSLARIGGHDTVSSRRYYNRAKMT